MARTQLYFWKPLMERYKKELSMVEEYYNRTKPSFDNIEQEANDYADFIYNNFPVDEDTDFSTVADYAHNEGIQLYDLLGTLKKNHILMTISMLCQIWEQQLTKFVLTEMRYYLKDQRTSLLFADVKKIFELHEVAFENLNSWGKIKEMRLLVNTIKHGDGDSARKLRKIRPNYFELGTSVTETDAILMGTDTLELAGAVLLESYSLSVEEQDIKTYVEATRTFWDEMPERAYSNINVISSVLNRKKNNM